jgi:hypothetical protein
MTTFITGDDPLPDHLRQLGADWDRYTEQLDHDPEWRDQMRRALVAELRAVTNRLAQECGAYRDDRTGRHER